MKFKKSPVDGTIRTRSGFLFFPKRMPMEDVLWNKIYQTRWLMKATWKEEYNACINEWRNHEWVD